MASIIYTDDLQGCSILLVEDEAIAAIDTQAILEMAGAKVIPAYSLGQGFHWFSGRRIDCAVLDINLHDELVFSLADALAERTVPIVFLSGHSTNIAPPQHQGCHFVHKPFSTHSLIRAILGATRRERIEERTAS